MLLQKSVYIGIKLGWSFVEFIKKETRASRMDPAHPELVVVEILQNGGSNWRGSIFSR